MTRIMTSIMALFVTPVYLLLLRYPDYVPDWLGFVMIQDEMNVPPLLQLLLLELAIDGLRWRRQHAEYADNTAQCCGRYCVWRLYRKFGMV